MKICVIGCSFSKFWGPEADIECWPKKLAHNNKDLKIYNTAIFGNSLDNQLFQIQEYINDFDNFVVQLTNPFRKTYAYNVDVYRARLKTFKLSGNYLELEDTINFEDNNFEKEFAVNYNASLAHNRNNKLSDHYTFDMRHNIINYVDSYNEMVVNQIKKTLKGKRYIIYSHLDRYSSEIDFSLEKDLDNSTWDSFVVDHGFHFGNNGTQYIADLLQKKISTWT